MSHVNSDTLESMKSISDKLTYLFDNYHFERERAITDLDRLFNIMTTVDNNNNNTKYSYKYSNGDDVYVIGDNPHEFLTYRLDLLKGEAVCYEISRNIYTNDFSDDNSENGIERINALVLDYVLSKNIRRGDVVHLECFGNYRNDGIVFFDGWKLIEMD